MAVRRKLGCTKCGSKHHMTAKCAVSQFKEMAKARLKEIETMKKITKKTETTDIKKASKTMKKTTAKKTTAVKKVTKPVKKATRGKAVVVYFNSDNLGVLAKAKAAAKKQGTGLNSIVAAALAKLLK